MPSKPLTKDNIHVFTDPQDCEHPLLLNGTMIRALILSSQSPLLACLKCGYSRPLSNFTNQEGEML